MRVCKVVMIGKYACNTHPVSVYYGEVDYGSKVMREGGRKDVVVTKIANSPSYRPNIFESLRHAEKWSSIFSQHVVAVAFGM